MSAEAYLEHVSVEQRAHVKALMAARPGCRVMVLSQLFSDEAGGVEGTHVYPVAHPYITGARYALGKVVPMAPCRVLDIGSPLAQNVAMAAMPGVRVTVVDVRPYPDPASLGLEWIVANGCDIPLPDGSQEVVTSFWTMCHVGDGRYGDDLRVDGDIQILREIARLLKAGGRAFVGVGPMDAQCGIIFNLHRIYSWDWVERVVAEVGLRLVEKHEVPVTHDMYLDGSYGDKPVVGVPLQGRQGVYGIMELAK